MKQEDKNLFAAAKKLDMKSARKALKNGADVNAVNAKGETVLMVAADVSNASRYNSNGDYDGSRRQKSKDKDFLLMLIDKGSSMSATDKHGDTVLIRTVKKYKSPLTNFFCDQASSTDIAVQDENGNSLLMIAIKNKISLYDNRNENSRLVSTMISTLLECGVDPNLPNNDGLTPIMITKNLNEISILINKGAELNIKDNFGYPAIIKAISNYGDNPQGFYSLFIKGNKTNIDEADAAGFTPLMHTIIQGKPEMTKSLIARGVDIDAKNNAGTTPLMLAAGIGNKEIVQVLLQNGADVNALNNVDESALTRAVENEHSSIIYDLLLHGAKVDVENSYGDSLVEIALSQSDYSIADLLAENGASRPGFKHLASSSSISNSLGDSNIDHASSTNIFSAGNILFGSIFGLACAGAYYKGYAKRAVQYIGLRNDEANEDEPGCLGSSCGDLELGHRE